MKNIRLTVAFWVHFNSPYCILWIHKCDFPYCKNFLKAAVWRDSRAGCNYQAFMTDLDLVMLATSGALSLTEDQFMNLFGGIICT